MGTPGTDSNESPRRQGRPSSVATPGLQLPSGKTQDQSSLNRLSETKPKRTSVASMQRGLVPTSVIEEEEKFMSNGEEDPTEIEKISVPVSGFDNKMSNEQRQ
jgi:hypothetical protein